jgi:hypothetical protein
VKAINPEWRHPSDESNQYPRFTHDKLYPINEVKTGSNLEAITTTAIKIHRYQAISLNVSSIGILKISSLAIRRITPITMIVTTKTINGAADIAIPPVDDR